MKISSLFIEMAADVARLRSDMDEAKKLVSRGMRGMEQAANAAKIALTSVTAGLGVREYVQAADAITQLQNKLKLATGSAQAAAAAYGQLFEVAQRSRVSFTELGGTYATIARSTKELGLTQGQLMTVTEAIGNAMTISGGSAESMNAALVQLGQGLGSGTLRGEELNSVMEQTPRLAQAIADGLGITIGQLRQYAQDGKLSAEAVTRALQSQAGVLAGEVQGATLTVGQAMTQLSNATVKTVGEIDRATGASASMAAGLQGLAGMVGAVGRAFAEHETAILTGLGMLAGAGTVAGLAAVTSAMGGVAGAIGIVKAAFVGLAAVAAANPIGLALLGIGAAVGGFVAYNSAVADSTEGLERRIYTLQERIKAGPSIYARDAEGMAQWQARVREMNAEVAALNRQLAEKRGPQIIGSVGSGDAALARAQRAEWDKAAGARAEYLAATRTASQKLSDELEKARKAFGGVVPPEVEAALRERFIKPTAAAGKTATTAADDFARLREQLAGQVADGYAQAQAAAQGLNSAQAEFLKLAGSERWAQMTNDQRAQVAALYETRIAQEQATAALKDNAAAQQLASKAYADSLKPYEDAARSAQGRLDALVQENQATALAERLNISLARAVELTAIARLREQQAAAMGDEAKVLAIQAEIDARQKLVDLMAGNEVRQAASDLRKREAQEWDRTWGQISQSFTNALMEGGKSVAEYLKGLFRTLVLRPIIAPVGAALASMLGGPAAAAQGGTGVLGSLGSGGSDVLGTIGQLAGIGSSLGTGIAAGFANALTGTFAGSLTAAGSLIGTGSVAGVSAGIGMGIGTIAPYALPAMAVYKLLTAETPGEQHRGGFYSSTGYTGLEGAARITASGANSGQARDLIDRADPGLTSQVQQTADTLLANVGAMAKTIGSQLALGLDLGFAANLNGQAGNSNAFGYFGVSANGQLVDTYQNRGLGSDVAKAYATLTEDAANALAEVVLGGTGLVRTGETAYQALQRLSGSLQGVNQVLDTLGQQAYATSLAGGDMASSLADLFGGLEAFSQASTAYYEAFYSEAERTATTTRQLTAALGQLGLQLPDTRDGYRALVDAQDLTTEAGRQTYATLLQLAPAFAELTQAMEQAGQGLADEIRRLRGLDGSSSAASLVDLQTQFALGTAAARAGDTSALQRLPELSKALESAAALQAVTSADVALIRGQLTASLSETMRVLGLDVPAFAVGTNYVPRDMLARIHEGEAIVPRAYNPAAGGAAPGSEAMAARLEAVVAELKGLRDEVRSGVTHSAKTARILDRVARDGDAFVTVTQA